MQAKTQDDIVKEEEGFRPEEETFKVNIPGAKELHTKPISEIAEVLATVLKSQANVVELRYRVGDSIQLTVKNL